MVVTEARPFLRGEDNGDKEDDNSGCRLSALWMDPDEEAAISTGLLFLLNEVVQTT
jgi:hypothetical protein